MAALAPYATAEEAKTLAETGPIIGKIMSHVVNRWVSQAIHAFVKLRIPDALEAGPKTATEIATALKLDAANLFRVLMLVEEQDFITAQDHPNKKIPKESRVKFSLTKMGTYLLESHPQGMRDAILLENGHVHYQLWDRFPLLVQQGGQNLWPQTFGVKSIWDYIPNHPDYGAMFDKGMASYSSHNSLPLAVAYDFSKFKRVVDIGGSHGALLRAIMKKWPNVTGTVMDLPAVINSPDCPKSTPELNFVSGDMFKPSTIPVGEDVSAYMMKAVLCDWNDEESRAILKSVLSVSKPGTTLLIFCPIVPDSGVHVPLGSAIKGLDLHMMIVATGKERNADEWHTLVSSAGWKVLKISPTLGLDGYIEAVKL